MKNYSWFLVAVFLLNSCKDNSVQPANSFSLTVQVKDNSGNVMPNVNVSMRSNIKIIPLGYPHKVSTFKNIPTTVVGKFNHITIIEADTFLVPQSFQLDQNYPNPFYDYTNIIFSLKQNCFVDISVYDLNGLKKTNLAHSKLNTGSYQLNTNWNGITTNGVYKVNLTTSSDSLEGNILFKDSIYVAFLQLDPAVTVAGKTDSNGKLTITDKLLFPNLYELPPLTRTSFDNPSPLGSFYYTDTVTITVSNETFSTTQSFNNFIKNGANSYILNWSK